MKNFSTFAIAQLLQVDPGSIANWIDQGLLRAHRTPGGHRRVAQEDLLKFLHDHKMPIPASLQAPPRRVLVVDDEPAIAEMICQAIAAAHPDYEVAQAHDGFEAGTKIAMLRPDVVVLDLRMPGMDGYEVCRVIKSQPAISHAQVLAMTPFPLQENEKSLLECGARVCLSKPLDMEILLREIDATI